jgi:phosphoglycolate phosphatase-like HAD superfamily hydrolase
MLPKQFLIERRGILAGLIAAGVYGLPIRNALGQSDPLASWRAGAAKMSITGFVARVTTQGGADFVPAAERIAVFDNDGTLWSEQPVYFQLAFALDRIAAMAPQHPEWANRQPFKAVLDRDMTALASTGEKGLMEIIAATHAGMTTEEFSRTVIGWMRTARHPRFHRPYTDLVYQPMLELLAYLRANGFKTFIVSGGGADFMRPWAEKIYGIPPEQVVGSSGSVRFEMRSDGKPVLVKDAKVEFVDDGPGKPVGIHRFIGRRPILAFGNSDGDLQMLQWTAAGEGARFAAIMHHTDGEREWAYDKPSKVGQLDKALDEAAKRGWLVVDMKRDWTAIYPFEAGGIGPKANFRGPAADAQ